MATIRQHFQLCLAGLYNTHGNEEVDNAEWLESTCHWEDTGWHSGAPGQFLSHRPPKTRPAAGRMYSSPSFPLCLPGETSYTRKLWLTSTYVMSSLSCLEKLWRLKFCFSSEAKNKKQKNKTKNQHKTKPHTKKANKQTTASQQAVEGFQNIIGKSMVFQLGWFMSIKKCKMGISFDPEIPLIRIYPNEITAKE